MTKILVTNEYMCTVLQGILTAGLGTHPILVYANYKQHGYFRDYLLLEDTEQSLMDHSFYANVEGECSLTKVFTFTAAIKAMQLGAFVKALKVLDRKQKIDNLMDNE